MQSSAAPVNAAPANFTTIFLQDGCFYTDQGAIFARCVSDWRAALLRPGIFILSTAAILGLAMLAFTLVPPARNSNSAWFHMSVILGSALLVLVVLLVNTPRRIVRVHAVSPDSLRPGELLLRLEETLYPIRDRRETRVFGPTGAPLGTLVTKPVTALTTYTWLNAQGSPLATAREASTVWNKAARFAVQNWIAHTFRNLFSTLWQHKVVPHTMRYWNVAPLTPANLSNSTLPSNISVPAAPPTTPTSTPPAIWAQIQSLRGSPMPILTTPDCPSEHRLIPLVLAESLAKHTLGWDV